MNSLTTKLGSGNLRHLTKNRTSNSSYRNIKGSRDQPGFVVCREVIQNKFSSPPLNSL